MSINTERRASQNKVASRNLDEALRSIILRLKTAEESLSSLVSSECNNTQIASILSQIEGIQSSLSLLISGNHVYGADIYISLGEPNNVNENDIWFDLGLVRFL